MCGIAGIFYLDGSPISCAKLLSMSRLIKHRGPDDEGFLLANTISNQLSHHYHDDTINEIKQKSSILPDTTSANLGMAYRRLSIIDLSPNGHQPMSDPEKNTWITFNGEIFNFKDIKRDLISFGHRFISNSDTEVLLHAYKQWNVRCLDRFIGMFSIAIYNHTDKSLFIARDRLGIKPFNYYFDGNLFIWASEEKQIVKSNFVNISPNEAKIVEFLRDNKCFEDHESFYKEIKQLPAGHYAILNKSGLQISRYWDLPKPSEMQFWNEEQSIQSIQSILKDSIKLRLQSDVPLGVALSGGIDSSTICCIARTLTNISIQTFSVYYEGKKYDERKYIQAVLDLGGFNPTFYTGNQNVSMEEISEWIYKQDAPTTSASPYSAYQNYKNVRKSGVTVLLNGQGGDELFAGYPYFTKYYFAQLIQENRYSELFHEILKIKQTQGLKNTFSHLYLSFIALQNNAIKLKEKEHNKYSSRNLYPASTHENNSPTKESLLRKAIMDSVKTTHLPHMLRWEDRNSMANSIESRVPFLDHRLVESSFNIPGNLKIHNGIYKYILRKSMKTIVPDMILDRRDKIGFGTPTTLWTQTTLASAISDILSSQSFQSRSWCDGKKIKQMFEKNPKSFGEHELWRIFTSELWYQSFFN